MKYILTFSVTFLAILILIVQSGCKENTDTPLPDVTAAADTIYGTVKFKLVDANGIQLIDWHYGPAMVRAGKLADAALTSKGTFTLILPKTVAGSNFMSMSEYAGIQGGTCVATPGNANFVDMITFMVDYSDNGVVKTMEITLSKYELYNNKPVLSKSYFYYFYDRDGTFTGTSLYAKTFNWTFSKGWGMIEARVSSTTSYQVSSTSVNSAPADAIWTN
jgi:hypothetical protein